jgi:hypothetical protein
MPNRLVLAGMGGKSGVIYSFQTTAASSGPTVLSHPDYLLEFVVSDTYLTGETLPLKWNLTRKDGSVVQEPTSATVTMRDSSGNQVGSTLSANPAAIGAQTTQELAALWTPPSVGVFTAKLVVSITDTDTQIRADTVIISVS